MKKPDPDRLDPTAAVRPNGHSPREAGSESLAVLVWLAELARSVQYDAAETHDCLGTAPQAIGHFRLEGLLGTGAYGAVFRAFDTELERWVALKVAWPHVMFDAVSSRRFVDEPKAAASLNHPGILKVHKSGSLESISYIALELIEGPTLGEWFKQQEHVSFRLAAQIVQNVAEAIHFAHRKDVIHRDLKPGNILLRPREGSEFPYQPVVGDFGLARRARLPATSNLTGTHDVLGTDPYISPEQLQGRSASVGPPSDVFSLGVILYELVAGRRPFDGETSDETRGLIKNEDPPPSVRLFRPRTPQDLETIIARCLQKSIADRYPTAQGLADDLERFLDGKPILARRIGIVQRSWKYAKRKPLVVSLVSLVLVSAVVTAGLLITMAINRVSAERQIAVAKTAASVAAGIERQHQYASNIQHAAEALRRGGRREVTELLEACRSLALEPVRLGIEWDLLWAQANDADRVLEAHSGSVHSVRFSSAGDLLISGGEDGKVLVWDTKLWTKRLELDDKVGEVNVAEPSPDASLMAVAGDDGRVVVHRLTDGATIFDRPIVNGRVFDLIWIDEGKQFAVGGDGAVLSIVDLSIGECRRVSLQPVLEPYQGNHLSTKEICGLAYVPERNAIAVVTIPQTVHLIDLASMTLPDRPFSLKGVSDICYVRLGSGYLATGASSEAQIRSIEDGAEIAEISLQQTLQCLRYSPHAEVLVTALRNGGVQTWDVKSILEGRSAELRRFCAHDGRTMTVDFSPDAGRLATGGRDGRIKLWGTRSFQTPFDQTTDCKPVSVAFSPCGRWLILCRKSADETAHFTMCDARTGKQQWTDDKSSYDWWLLSQSPIPFSPDGNEVALLVSGTIVRRDSRTGEILSAWPKPNGPPMGTLWFSSEGRSLVTTLADYQCFVLDRQSGEVIEHSPASSLACLGMFHTNHGDLLVQTDSLSRKCLLRSSLAMPPILTLAGPTERLSIARVSPDGRYLAAASEDHIIYVWDLDQSGSPSKLVGHEAGIVKLCFAPDGGTILSHSTDGTVRFWHISTRAELLKLGTPEEPVICMDLHPAGNLLVLGVERRGAYGLQIHRLGPDRQSLPTRFDLAPLNGQ